MTPSPPDSPSFSCVVSPRLTIEPIKFPLSSPSPPPELSPSPPSVSPLPIAVVTSFTAVFMEPNSPITVPSPSAPSSPITSLALFPISSIAPVRELPPPSPSPLEPLPPDSPLPDLELEPPELLPPAEPSLSPLPPPPIAEVTSSIAVLRLVNCAIMPSSNEILFNASIAEVMPLTAPSSCPSIPAPNTAEISMSWSYNNWNDVVRLLTAVISIVDTEVFMVSRLSFTSRIFSFSKMKFAISVVVASVVAA